VGEVDSIIAAGMGGGLVIKILTDNPEITASIKEFILQPQSEIFKVRKFLQKNGFVIVEEDMVEEDGKFYPMMRVLHADDCEKQECHEAYLEAEYIYGRFLLQNAHPVLKEFLNREKVLKAEIIGNLKARAGANAQSRIDELEKEQIMIEKILAEYFA
jgi:tRNA (adenine22-N1)-methyltransferase